MKVPTQRSEARLCTLLIGAIQVIWSMLPVTGGDWRFQRILRHYEYAQEWLSFMALCGVLLIIGALCPWRSGRHMGLFLSSTVWFSSFGMWLNYWAETGKWLVSPTTMLFPLLGLFCLVLFYNDVAQKPRGEK